MTEISIEKIKKHHLSDVYSLLQDISVYLPAHSSQNMIWESFSQQENVHGWVVLTEKQVIGYGSVVLETKIRGGTAAHIEDIVIDPKYRKKNLGRFLVNFILEFATRKGCYKASLQCLQTNADFYQSMGFQRSDMAMQKFL